MARRSTRLSSRGSATPQPIKRVSLSHDAPTIRTPRTVPAKLSSLQESDEMPGAFPDSPAEHDTPTVPSKRVRMTEPEPEPEPEAATTPKATTPIRPSDEEMHPARHHETTAKPREEARWLGFSKMAPATEPPKRNDNFMQAQTTPSRSAKVENPFKSPDYQFTFRREQSLELSPEAKKLMEEKRAEAIKIKEQMKASGEGLSSPGEAAGRKMMALPKGKKGRFSDLHAAQFNKMDSIAGHASAFRKDPTRTVAFAAESKVPIHTPAKSLKRSPSKAELDKSEGTPTKSIARSTSRPNLLHPASSLPRAPSVKNLRAAADEDASPAKRVKRAADETKRPTSSSSAQDKNLPSTPQHKSLLKQPSYPNLSHLTTPTQSSLARTGSIKSLKTASKIPGLGLARSPSKPNLVGKDAESPRPSTPLLAKSPTKGSLFANHGVETAEQPESKNMSPLLSRSPVKGLSQKPAYPSLTGSTSPPQDQQAPLLSRTPARPQHPQRQQQDPAGSPSPVKEQQQAPLLSRSPLKMSIVREQAVEAPVEKEKVSSIPMLSRSPMKASVNKNPFQDAPAAETPAKSGLMSRFNLLRSSPIKSILRSPQRLYSNDPAKVAAGTHLATPPKLTTNKNKSLPQVPATAPVRKHVDFSLSTKEREASKSASPSDGPTPPPRDSAPTTMTSFYPSLPTIASPSVAAAPTPDRRRQTIAPGDFTFRAGSGIVFGTSPRSTAAATAQRANTIRHVSADPEIVPSAVASTKKRKFDFENRLAAQAERNPSPTVGMGSKKRKFDFENEAVEDAAAAGSTSDKENAGAQDEDVGVERPAKRAKSSVLPSFSAPTTSSSRASSAVASSKKEVEKEKEKTRLPTLGVKPKGGKAADGEGMTRKKKESSSGGAKAGSISRARLNALAMPKKRG